MIFRDFLRAVRQMGDARFRSVLIRGIGLTVLLLAAITALFLTVIGWFVPDEITLPWVGSFGGLDAILSWGSVALMIGLSVFLMVPVAAAFTGFFLDDVADAVEARHYPALPAATPVPLATALIDSVNFLGVIIAVNVVALIVYPFSGPFAPILFWVVNGYLLGREYFTLVAMRRLGRQGARDLRRRHAGQVWLAGALMAAPLSIPLVNLLVPVLGVATFTHLVQRVQAQAPSRPGNRNP
jgi:CysZ protein